MSAEKGEVIISVNDLKKHYGGGDIKALDGITTDLHKGEVVVVIGPSGSMARALTMAILCFCPPESCDG